MSSLILASHRYFVSLYDHMLFLHVGSHFPALLFIHEEDSGIAKAEIESY